MSGDDQLRLERIDLLKFQTSEIDAAGTLQPGEDEKLRTEREVLRHAEAIAGALHQAVALLSEDDQAVDSRLAQAGNALEGIARWQPEAGSWADTLAEAGALVNDLAADLRTQAAGCEPDPIRLNQIEERLSVIERLIRKYGGSSADVLEHGRRLAEELLELETADVRRDEVERQAAALSRGVRRRGRRLCHRPAANAPRRWRAKSSGTCGTWRWSAQRVRGRDLGRELRAGSPLELNGEHVAFDRFGVDRVTYRFSANPGEALRPLAKVASGGELARLFLALQTAVRGAGTG